MGIRRILFTLGLVGILTVGAPNAGNAFFNKDCSNLKKRVASSQVRYEKAWNVYQQVLANWINSRPKGSEMWATSAPVMNRFKQVGNIQVEIIDDLIKYPKCLKSGAAGSWTIEKQNLTKLMNTVDYMSLYFNNYFSTVFDYRKTLK